MLVDGGCGAVVHGLRRRKSDAAVTMCSVVPVEELLTVRACVLDRAEALRKIRPVLQGFELRLRVERSGRCPV